MTEVAVQIRGTLYDLQSKSARQVMLEGKATAIALPPVPGDPPLGIWGPTDPRPSPPIHLPPEGEGPPHIWGPPDMPPGFWGGGMGPGVKPQPHPEHPIVLPPEQTPPGMQPPAPPSAGDPTTVVPPPEGSAGWPVSNIVPPAYMTLNWPGIGPVTVAPPLTAQPK